jgi:hypothetical protein
MKSKKLKKIGIILLFLAVAAFALSGCSGGSDGAAGATGPEGPEGPAGPVTLTSESCLVCHNANDVASVEIMHSYTLNTTTNTRTTPRLNEKNLAVSNIVVSATATNLPSISFNVKNGTANYATLVTGDVRFYIADQVPANTVTGKGTFGSPYWENWGYATPTTTGAVWDVSGAAAGNYSITFPTAFGVAASTSYNAADYNATHVQRLYIRLSSTVAGVGGAAGILDFNVPAAGATAVALANPQNQYVTIEACRKCHGPQLNGAAHGSSYIDTLACIMCHSPLAGGSASASASEYYLPEFIHKIHAAIDIPNFSTRILGRGYKDVTYPQPINNCVVCHTASGKNLGAGDKIDNWKNNPTAEICGSCHEGFPVGHAGGTAPQCTICHPATGTGFGKSVTEAHKVTPAAKDVSEYVATMTITAPANGTYYVAGEAPTVTVTLKDKAGAAVPGTLYTAAKHAAGTFDAASLSKAALYVYGPRANAVPVLTKGAATLTAAGVPTQSNSLLLPSTDAQVTTSTAGFSYKLTAIPAGTTSGTYMVRFSAANYGYKSDTDYKIDSTAFKTIQIGTATAEQKLSGNACVDCHGTGTLGAHDARHSVVFDTDECISCHDKSGNHANPIDNRVHAIHSASLKGDLLDIDWTAVTYPQGIPAPVIYSATTPRVKGQVTSTAAVRCITCHTSTSTKYKTTSVSERACIGCHADKPGAIDHFLQNGGK